jgi:hypothetical protein
MYSWIHCCMSEHVVLVISLESWQYCHWQSVVKMAVLILYLNSIIDSPSYITVPQHTSIDAGGMYSSYSFITSALDGSEWSASRLCGSLAPVPIGQDTRDGLATEFRGRISCLCLGSNLDRPVVQSVAGHYTDWATPAPYRRTAVL